MIQGRQDNLIKCTALLMTEGVEIAKFGDHLDRLDDGSFVGYNCDGAE